MFFGEIMKRKRILRQKKYRTDHCGLPTFLLPTLHLQIGKTDGRFRSSPRARTNEYVTEERTESRFSDKKNIGQTIAVFRRFPSFPAPSDRKNEWKNAKTDKKKISARPVAVFRRFSDLRVGGYDCRLLYTGRQP